MIRAFTWILAFLAGLIIVFRITVSCTHNAMTLDDFPEICFERDILPVFQNGCALSGCHDEQGHRGGYSFNTYDGIIAGITPGSLSKSEVYKVIASSGFFAMPPDAPLGRDERVRIRLWIEQGAQLTTCPDSTGGDTTMLVKYPVCFDRDLKPVFLSNCAKNGCHDEVTAKEGIRLTDYTAILSGDELVNPGKPAESKIYKVITRDPEDEDFMPPKPSNPLSQSQVDSIFNWIKSGAKKEECPVICDTLRPVTYEDQILPVIRKYCLGCHSGSRPTGGLSLTDYLSVKQAVQSGPLLNAVNRTGPTPMPPTASLDDCTVNLFINWQTDGYIEKKGGLQ